MGGEIPHALRPFRWTAYISDIPLLKKSTASPFLRVGRANSFTAGYGEAGYPALRGGPLLDFRGVGGDRGWAFGVFGWAGCGFGWFGWERGEGPDWLYLLAQLGISGIRSTGLLIGQQRARALLTW